MKVRFMFDCLIHSLRFFPFRLSCEGLQTAEEIKVAAELTHSMSERALARLDELVTQPTLKYAAMRKHFKY